MNRLLVIALKIAGISVLAQLGHMLIGGAFVAVFGEVFPAGGGAAEVLPPMYLGTLLTVAALAYPVSRSALRGGRLLLATLLAVLGINVILVHVEAVVFLDLTQEQIAFAWLNGALSAAWTTCLVVWAFRDRTPAAAPPHAAAAAGIRPWVLATAAYVVLYLVAGMLIYPMVQAYYESQGLDAGIWVLPLQVARGALYVAFAYWLLRSLRVTRWQAALSMACLFPLLAGVAALMIPSGFMPDHVRFWHCLEIGASNFLYGLLVGYLFWNPAQSVAARVAEVGDDPG